MLQPYLTPGRMSQEHVPTYLTIRPDGERSHTPPLHSCLLFAHACCQCPRLRNVVYMQQKGRSNRFHEHVASSSEFEELGGTVQRRCLSPLLPGPVSVNGKAAQVCLCHDTEILVLFQKKALLCRR